MPCASICVPQVQAARRLVICATTCYQQCCTSVTSEFCLAPCWQREHHTWLEFEMAILNNVVGSHSVLVLARVVWGDCAAVTLSYMGIVVVTLLILLCSLKEHGLSLFNIQKLAMYAAGAGGDSSGHPALTVQDGHSGSHLLHMVHDRWQQRRRLWHGPLQCRLRAGVGCGRASSRAPTVERHRYSTHGASALASWIIGGARQIGIVGGIHQAILTEPEQ